MLPSPNLNDQAFEDIVERALKMMETRASGIDTDNIHDPGVTLAELISYMKLRQQGGMNRVGEKSLLKYMKLLGMVPKGAKPAFSHASFATESDCGVLLPAGTKLSFDGVVFETEEELNVLCNDITAECERYPFGDPPVEGASFVLDLLKPLPPGVLFCLFLDVAETKGAVRNPVTEPGAFVQTSLISWEFFGEEGWTPLTVLSDTTYNMLFPGIIRLKAEGLHCPIEGKWPIRCVLKRDLYETAPKLEGVWINAARIIQADTKCLSVTFSRGQLKECSMPVNRFLGYGGKTELFIKAGGFWVRGGEYGVEHILRGNASERRLHVSNMEGLIPRFEHAADSDDALKLVIYEREFYERMPRASGTGFCGQTLSVPVGVCREGLQLMVSGNRGFGVYKPVYDFDNSALYDRHFVYSERYGLITFGDNERGTAPFPGAEIIVTGLVMTMGSKGVIKENSLVLYDNGAFPDVRVLRNKRAQEGRDAETNEEAMARIQSELKRARRAVTCSDYEEVAKKAQGVMLKGAAALPLCTPKGVYEENAVTVVVEPFAGGGRLNSAEYLGNIWAALDKARLITTRVYVCFPVRLGLEAHCEVVVSERSKRGKEEIAALITEYVEGLPLGGSASHADVCGAIDASPRVLYTKYLSMEAAGMKGKNHLGDVLIPQHARLYVKALSITEVLS